MDILVLDTEFKAVSIVDTFESFIWTDRYNTYGDFEIYCPMDTKLLDIFKEDYYLWIAESEHLMIIENLSIDSDVEDGDRLTVTGRSLESILDRRVVWGQANFTGNLQEAVKTLLYETFIEPEIEERKIANFIFEESTDPKITELTVDVQYTGDDLYSIITELCEKHNIGFKIVLNDNNQFLFSLYAGVDRSYEQTTNPYVIFSPKFENLINANYYTSKAEFKNVALVAGEGEGVNRRSTIVGSASGLDRREVFTQASTSSTVTADDEDTTTKKQGTSPFVYTGEKSSDSSGSSTSEKTEKTTNLSDEEYTAMLTTEGNKSLTKHEVTVAFEGEVDATQMFTYGEDFFVGDIVQITDDYGHEGVVYIPELVISYNEDGFSIYPTFKTIPEKEGETE